MATVKRFEDLEVWQLARVQCRELHVLFKAGTFKNDFALWNQISRSSGSVMDNISEGFDRNTRPDFRHFLVIARGSNAEVRSQLYRALDCGYLPEETFGILQQATIHLSVKLYNFINYLSSTNISRKPDSNYYNQKAQNPQKVEEPGSIYQTQTQDDYEIPKEFFTPIHNNP